MLPPKIFNIDPPNLEFKNVTHIYIYKNPFPASIPRPPLHRAGSIVRVVRDMKSKLSPSARGQLDRFSRQYFQLEGNLIFPDESCLRNNIFQQALVADLFKGVTIHAPPLRYQLRILKLLVEKIEQSIQDWDEEVCHLIPCTLDRIRWLAPYLIFV